MKGTDSTKDSELEAYVAAAWQNILQLTCTHRETGGIEPGRLQLADQPAAYLTGWSPGS